MGVGKEKKGLNPQIVDGVSIAPSNMDNERGITYHNHGQQGVFFFLKRIEMYTSFRCKLVSQLEENVRGFRHAFSCVPY